MELTAILAVWATILSTILAIVKGIEFWRGRLSIDVQGLWRGHEEIGNEILIINKSSSPVFIYNYDLVRAHRPDDDAITETIFHLEDNFCQIKLSSMESEHLRFTDGNHFPIRSKSKGEVYMRLWISGRRKPIWEKPFGFIS